jgi:glycosyltransferase involved in cell wall biosynthesis
LRILILAPQPFYVERGTPISVDLLLRELSEAGHKVDLVTYHLGIDRDYPGLRIFRVKPRPRPAAIGVGFSLAKLYCDLFLMKAAVTLLRKNSYDLVYAVEEAVFLALLLRWPFKVPYVYDMDSLLSAQLTDKVRWLKPALSVLQRLEGVAVKKATMVVPMCDALAAKAAKYRSDGIYVLRDVSLRNDCVPETAEDLRASLKLNGKVVMYIGNLEPYQGIDLLLESFAKASEEARGVDLVMIGGQQQEIAHYTARAASLGLGQRTHFVGPRPVAAIGAYMAQADVLVSPRLKGTNTPMKIYSYMDSGRAVLATDLLTHTQVLDRTTAALAPPEPAAFGSALAQLLNHPEECERLAENARSTVASRHSLAAFHASVNELLAHFSALV